MESGAYGLFPKSGRKKEIKGELYTNRISPSLGGK